MPQISVIVPVYKVEPYLPRCIDSILAQTFTDFELILVDDGSPDNCGAICDEYAAKDKRVRVIHQANGGASSARNAGLDAARGDYIAFVDGDDRIHPDMLGDALAGIEGFDSVCFNYHTEDPAGKTLRRSSFPPGSVSWKSEYEQFVFFFVSYLGFRYAFSVWNKLYRKSIIDQYHIRFENNESYAEDLFFNFIYYLHTNSLNCLKGDYYTYLAREGSIIHSLPPLGNLDRVVRLVKTLEEYLSKQDGMTILKEKFSVLFCAIFLNELGFLKREFPAYNIRTARRIIYSEVKDVEYFRKKTAELLRHRKDLQIKYGWIDSHGIISEFRYFLDGRLGTFLCRQTLVFCMRAARKILRKARAYLRF